MLVTQKTSILYMHSPCTLAVLSLVFLLSKVDLRIDFGGIVHLSHATLTWKSVRPRCMVIERSIDHGVTWHVYQHFAKSCQQCFGLPEVFGPVPVSQRGNSSIFSLGCTSRYAPGSQTTSNEVIVAHKVTITSVYLFYLSICRFLKGQLSFCLSLVMLNFLFVCAHCVLRVLTYVQNYY